MKTVVLLWSSLTTDTLSPIHTQRLENVLVGNKVVFEKIDGSMAEVKEQRDKLFAVSEKRGKYPQCFIKDAKGDITFVGMWEEIEGMVECDSYPPEVLEQNPGIPTFQKAFCEVQRTEMTIATPIFECDDKLKG